MWLKTLVLTCAFWPGTITADTHNPVENFSHVATISAGKQSLREFILPYEIIAHLKRQDRGDLRIINAQQQPVPFTLSERPSPEICHKSVHTLNFYPLKNAPSAEAVELRLDLNNDSQIRIIPSEPDKTADTHYIIIENDHRDATLYRLQLHWTPPSASFSIPVRLEKSDDLQNWYSLVPRVLLYDLKHQDTSLQKNTLKIPRGTRAKYLRLGYQHNQTFADTLTKITADYQESVAAENDLWQPLPPLQRGDRDNTWLFTTPVSLSITQIEFDIPQTGLIYQGTLYSKRPQKHPPSLKHKEFYKQGIKKILHKPKPRSSSDWYYQAAFNQYRLNTDAGEIHSPPLHLNGRRANEWKLVFTQPEPLLPEQLPSLKIAWKPLLITFLAQGKGPFKLYFGNPEATPQKTGIPAIAKAEPVEKVRITRIEPLNKIQEPRKKLFAFADKTWKTALLWALLCLGIVQMIYMSYRLFSKIASGKN